MKNIGIVFCSTAAITKEFLNYDNMCIVSLHVTIGDKEYQSSDLNLKSFFKILEEQKVTPKTSQPSRIEFEKVFQAGLKMYDQLICITPSINLSGSYGNAKIAAKEIDNNRIAVVDSQAICMTENRMIIRAQTYIEQGLEFAEIIKRLTDYSHKFITYAVPGSLNYLKHSGRVDLKSMIIGTLLNIKVLVRVFDNETTLFAKGRGYKAILKVLNEEIDTYQVEEIIYTSILEDESTQQLFLNLFKSKGLKVTLTEEADIVCASHFGPQSLGFTFICK